jgi:hypothetical protein
MSKLSSKAGVIATVEGPACRVSGEDCIAPGVSVAVGVPACICGIADAGVLEF